MLKRIFLIFTVNIPNLKRVNFKFARSSRISPCIVMQCYLQSEFIWNVFFMISLCVILNKYRLQRCTLIAHEYFLASTFSCGATDYKILVEVSGKYGAGLITWLMDTALKAVREVFFILFDRIFEWFLPVLRGDVSIAERWNWIISFFFNSSNIYCLLHLHTSKVYRWWVLQDSRMLLVLVLQKWFWFRIFYYFTFSCSIYSMIELKISIDGVDFNCVTNPVVKVCNFGKSVRHANGTWDSEAHDADEFPIESQRTTAIALWTRIFGDTDFNLFINMNSRNMLLRLFDSTCTRLQKATSRLFYGTFPRIHQNWSTLDWLPAIYSAIHPTAPFGPIQLLNVKMNDRFYYSIVYEIATKLTQIENGARLDWFLRIFNRLNESIEFYGFFNTNQSNIATWHPVIVSSMRY